MRKILFISLLLFILSASFQAQTTQINTDTVMVLPFENVSGKPEFNWVGESFADSVSDLLTGYWLPSAAKATNSNRPQNLLGFTVVSNDARKIIQQRLRVPLTTLPSLATSLKLAREGKATLLIFGKYDIVPAQGDTAAAISVTTKIIRVNEGRFLNEELSDGRRFTREINLTDALANLQKIEGQITHQIIYRRDKSATAFAEKDIVEAANKVPARAFEAYIKGLLTPEGDAQTREAYFKNAMRLYAEAKTTDGAEEANKIYADAALELGHLFLNQRQMPNAIEYFSKVPQTDTRYAEATFYAGLIYWQQKNYETALSVLSPLADDLKLTSVYNTLGAISVEASRAEKKNATKEAKLLNDGVEFLKKASESESEETNSRFNYGVALFLSNNFAESIKQLLAITEKNQRDGEVYFLLAKAFEKNGDGEKAKDADDKARRFLTENNKYAQLETDWKNNKIDGVNLRVEQPPRKDFVSVVLLSKKDTPMMQTSVNETDTLLEQAKTFYSAGRDDDAMAILRRIVNGGDPMSAKAYLMIGKINLRRADMIAATDSLKTALFWDNSLIDAHIALAKIFLEKKDCQQSQSYVASAFAIDENNQEVLALQRQIERCGK
jgi:tetratricopeptide (TPR) repeat protein